MSRTENYLWSVWTNDCAMAVYITDPSHTPPQWQEEWTDGPDYQRAVKIVQADKAEAEVVGYRQSTINEAARLYRRTNQVTGNAWEIVLDEAGNEVPSTCETRPGGDPRNFTYELSNVTIAGQYLHVGTGGATQLRITVTGNIPQA